MRHLVKIFPLFASLAISQTSFAQSNCAREALAKIEPQSGAICDIYVNSVLSPAMVFCEGGEFNDHDAKIEKSGDELNITLPVSSLNPAPQNLTVASATPLQIEEKSQSALKNRLLSLRSCLHDAKCRPPTIFPALLKELLAKNIAIEVIGMTNLSAQNGETAEMVLLQLNSEYFLVFGDASEPQSNDYSSFRSVQLKSTDPICAN